MILKSALSLRIMLRPGPRSALVGHSFSATPHHAGAEQTLCQLAALMRAVGCLFLLAG